MKTPAIVLGLAFLTLSLGLAQSSAEEPSLAELARQEKERRSKIKQEVPLITNEILATMTRARVSQATRSVEPEQEAQETKEPSTEPLQALEEKEIDWRQLFGEATLAYRTAVNNHLVLQLRFNNLRNAFFNEDDGSTQSLLQNQMQETVEKIEANQKILDDCRQKIAELQKAAAEAGLTPGEIRELVGELPEPESVLSSSTPTP
ncbi:MAG TPA: hypothetical protein VKZ59_03225 [Acidobacteriota bacterium]|nr:hypothetical protein [Acidobacteriota bacterium]